MIRFAVFDAAQEEQRRAWMALWERWPERGVSAHPTYAQVFAAPGERAVCATLETADGGLLFPLLLRPLDREPWDGTTGLWDATSPYGYSGPYCWGCLPDEVRLFWEELRGWAGQSSVVSLVARLSLFPEELAGFEGTVTEIMPNVVRSLDLDSEALWMDYKHGVRKSVKRAQREGVRIEVDPGGARLDDFLRIYHDTMERRGATAFYRFDRGFFERLLTGLPGQVVFFHALHNDRVVSTDLSLVSRQHVYSFLGGTAAEALKLNANTLLTHEAIQWSVRSGRKAYILGGGYGDSDSILAYKSQFAPSGIVPFRIGQITFDAPACERLVEARRTWEAAQGREWHPRPRYFPLYRA